MIGATAIRRLGVRRLTRRRRTLSIAPRLRRRLLAIALAALALGAGYLLWLRDSSLVAVQEVTVTGLTGDGSARVRAALTGAAREGTTLHVARGAIERAADAFPTIRAVEISPDFPHAMTIRVIEHRPAAVLVLRGSRVPVAGDGSILAGIPVRSQLPEVKVEGASPGRRLGPGTALDAVRVAGGAPRPLSGRLEWVARQRGKGIVVGVKDGPDLVFGDATRIAAKWAAAVRVLADPDATGADYVDVRIPERPAAGGLPVSTVAPVAPAGPARAPGTAQSAPDQATSVPPSAPPASQSPQTTPPPSAPATGPVPQASPGGGGTGSPTAPAQP